MVKKNLGLKIALYIFIAVLMIIYLFPLFFAFNTSFKIKSDFDLDPIGITKTLYIQNYIEAFKKANFAAYVGNSIFYTVICTGISILMSIFLAFPISRKYLKLSGALFTLFLLGMFLPDGTIPQFQILLKLGLYDSRLGYMLGMIGGGGMPLIFFVSYLKGIPREFDEAASIDGCGYFRYVFQILIPLMKPAIASMTVITAIGVWNDIIRSLIYLSSKALFPITRGLYVFQGQYNSDRTQQMAALIMVALPLVLLYIFLQRYIIDGAIAGAIKS